MIDHPFSMRGWLLLGIGFVMLIFWVPTDADLAALFGPETHVFNLHKAAISGAVMLAGLALIGKIAELGATLASLERHGAIARRQTGG